MNEKKPQVGVEINRNVSGWRPTGDADAVFYLAAAELVRQSVRGMMVDTVLIPSLEGQAMRYLRPCAQSWYNRWPGQSGITTDFRLRGFIEWLPEALVKQATEQGRPIGHALCADSPLAKDSLSLLYKLVLVEAEPGIWCGYYRADDGGETPCV